MDKRQIRKYKRMVETMRLAESRYTRSLVESMSSSCSDDTIASLEGSQRMLEEDIRKLRAILDGPFDVSEDDIIKTDEPMRPMD